MLILRDIKTVNLAVMDGIEMTISCRNGENMKEKHKPMDFELCDYDEGFSRLEASDIGWCGTCKIPNCPYNKNLEEKTKIRV